MGSRKALKPIVASQLKPIVASQTTRFFHKARPTWAIEVADGKMDRGWAEDGPYDEWGVDPPGYEPCDKKAHVHKVFRPGNYSPRFVLSGVAFYIGFPFFIVSLMFYHSMTKGGFWDDVEKEDLG